MRFAQWFTEMEQNTSFPSPKKYYLACVLNPISQEHLIVHAKKIYTEQNGTGIPKGWVYKSHHMTVNPKPTTEDFKKFQNFFGKDSTIRVLSLGWDEHCIAAKVDCHVYSTNPIKHITIAHSNDVGAEHSNTVLQNPKNIRPYSEYNLPLDAICLAVLKYDQNKYWPEIGYRLAAPSLVT